MTKEITAIVEKVTRGRNSASGNPRKRLWTDKGVFYTKKDAMCAYTVSDYWTNKPVTLTLEYGEVIGVTQVSS